MYRRKKYILYVFYLHILYIPLYLIQKYDRYSICQNCHNFWANKLDNRDLLDLVLLFFIPLWCCLLCLLCPEKSYSKRMRKSGIKFTYSNTYIFIVQIRCQVVSISQQKYILLWWEQNRFQILLMGSFSCNCSRL